MLEENKRVAQRALDEVFAAGNLAALDEIFHPDFINHEAGPDTPPGREGLKVTVQWMRSSFGDLSYEVEDAIAEDDRVVLRVISRGRQTGEFMGFPATGKEFAVNQIHVYRIADGKVLEHWAVRDDLGQGIQLGLIPGGGPPGAERPSETGLSTDRSAEPSVDVSGQPLTRTAQIPVGGGLVIADKKVVITQPKAGRFSAFSATCTHMGCTVSEVSDGLIKCPCHGSRFAIADGSVAHGPAARPLPRYEIRLVGDDVTIVAANGSQSDRHE